MRRLKPVNTESQKHVTETLKWNFPYLDVYYLGTSIVCTAQITCGACSLLIIMKEVWVQ